MKTKQVRSERSRKIILENALALFRKNGFEATTMRDIANEAGMALGAAYYHFKQKEELVFDYYIKLQDESEEQARSIISETKSFHKRLSHALHFKIKQLTPDRNLVKVLARTVADPDSQLSPFSPESVEVRDRAIEMMQWLIDGSDLKVSSKFKPSLKTLLWFYYMAIIFFWAHDRSLEQQRTTQLIDLSLKLVTKVLWLSTLPLTGPVNSLVAKILKLTEEAIEEKRVTN
jgi:AcrR family transcriptional regulator